MTATHHPGYQRRDFEVVDYQEYLHEPSGLYFRGPSPPLEHGGRISFLGAAQTFGCFTDTPFPSLVGDALDTTVLNLGYGGAGPRFYLEHPTLIDEINGGTAAVVQVMSGRSEDNRLYVSGGLEYLRRRSDGARVGAGNAYAALAGGYDAATGKPRNRQVRRITSRLGRRRLRSVVAETQRNWLASYHRLFEAITVPTVLLWFATRRPEDHVVGYRSGGQLLGEFPQLVTGDMVDDVRRSADRYVAVVTDEGLPQPLLSRFDGSPVTVDPSNDRPDLGGEVWSHNRYYPSPEMHRRAADAIAPVLAELLR